MIECSSLFLSAQLDIDSASAILQKFHGADCVCLWHSNVPSGASSSDKSSAYERKGRRERFLEAFNSWTGLSGSDPSSCK